jgi:hypothetical protein
MPPQDKEDLFRRLHTVSPFEKRDDVFRIG